MAAITKKAEDKDAGNIKTSPAGKNDLKTEGPLSERDEVKKAEQQTSKAVKKAR